MEEFIISIKVIKAIDFKLEDSKLSIKFAKFIKVIKVIKAIRSTIMVTIEVKKVIELVEMFVKMKFTLLMIMKTLGFAIKIIE